MFVRTLDGFLAQGKGKVAMGGKGRKVRLLTKIDGLGFSLSDTPVAAGLENSLWYKNHWEANYVVSGRGEVRDLTTGESHPLAPGTLYTVGPRDRHVVAAIEDLRIVSVFNPPVVGDETHDADGAYPPSGPVPEGQERMFVRTVEALRAAGREKVLSGGGARSVRMLLKADGVGFSFSDMHKAAGAGSVLWYKNHWEANYVLEGTGEVTDLTTDESWALAPGVLYCVGPEDRHRMAAVTDLHLISVFCPALEGDETHDADGAYPPSGPIPPGPKTA